ncbi:hypothetical protein [Mycobacterium tilburgii]|uniref:hypothetical protein n=1 Tax=Mycobacterium tilburgii TaxID=44467 RepID=UPI001183C2AD|nr:hypothetical protein [Mycobacterium tilburgii]
MICRRVAGALGAVAAAVVIPVPAQGAPPTKCLTNTQTGKQVYVPCDLLNAGANFPPGQRCPLPLDQYPKDVADWCGVGPGLASTTPTSPISPTTPRLPPSLAVDEPDDFHEQYDADDFYDAAEFCNHHDCHKPGGSGRCRMTTITLRLTRFDHCH